MRGLWPLEVMVTGEILWWKKLAEIAPAMRFLRYKFQKINNLDYMAESGGFEPPVQLSPYNGLAILPLRMTQSDLNYLQSCCLFKMHAT